MEVSPTADEQDVEMEEQQQQPQKKAKRRDFCHVCHSSTAEDISYHRKVPQRGSFSVSS